MYILEQGLIEIKNFFIHQMVIGQSVYTQLSKMTARADIHHTEKMLDLL